MPESTEEKKSDWKQYEETKVGSVIKTQYDQKIYLLDINTQRIDFKDVITLVTKELDTSFINDLTLKYQYQTQFENVLEWTQMGLVPLAKLRLAKLFGELKIEKSIGGMERILQGSELSGSVIATLPASKGLFSPISIGRKSQEKKSVVEHITGQISGETQ